MKKSIGILKTENLVKILKRFWWIPVIIAIVLVVYLKGIPMTKKVVKAYEDLYELSIEKEIAEEREKELKKLLKQKEKSLEQLENTISTYKEKLDESNKKLGRKISTIKFLPPSDRDLIWADFEQFISDSRKDSNK
jgi:uncharacterized protein YlxW (UPF0749 family)